MNIEANAETTTTTPARPIPAPATRPTRVTWFRPATDVWEQEDELVLVLDLPGVAPDAVDVRTEGLTLTVQGVRASGDRGWYRVFTLPPTIDPAGITAKSENGVLTLTLPRAESAKPRRIAVS